MVLLRMYTLKKIIQENAKAYVNSFTDIADNLACYAVKSLSNLSILNIIKNSWVWI